MLKNIYISQVAMYIIYLLLYLIPPVIVYETVSSYRIYSNSLAISNDLAEAEGEKRPG